MVAARAARAEPAVLRMLAIAGALERDKPSLNATRLMGAERQTLRDAVVRDNVEDIAGLYDRPCAMRSKASSRRLGANPRHFERLGEADQAALAAAPTFPNPDPEALQIGLPVRRRRTPQRAQALRSSCLKQRRGR